MNYYEHHLGDYLRDTAHLSMVEDGAYRRLIDAYYIAEAPFPDDRRDLLKIARAVTKAERDAVDYVLKKFFIYEPGRGWSHARCDREIARYQTKQSKARASAEARWGKCERNANASPKHDAQDMRTHSERNANGMHRAPVPSPQTPDPNTEYMARTTAATVARDPPEANGHSPTPAGAVCRAMKRAGLSGVNPGDPRLLALLEQGATEAEFSGIAAEAAEKGKGFAWVMTVLQSRRVEAAQIRLAPGEPPPDADAWMQKRSAVINRGCQLGIGPWNESAAVNGAGPTWEQYRTNVIAEHRRQGGPA